MNTHQLSAAAHQRLTREYHDLTTRGRIEVAEKIERAREMGDLKENGDYHAAKDEQGHMEGRIRQLEAILGDAEIAPLAPAGIVGFGAIVTVLYHGENDSERFLIGHVEERPADENVSVMSPNSPLGSALLGAKIGATVSYEAPNGTLRVKVLDTRIT